MDPAALHRDALIIDGLNICNWSRAVFDDMRKGGVTAVNCTCSTWENFRDSIRNVVRFKEWIDQHADILLQVHTAADIERAKRENKTGIILGWQNTSGIEDQLDYLRVFRDLGVRIMQLTYNTQNLSGAGCWEKVDPGLSGWGEEVVDRMNALGILCDLSHVGPQTTLDAIAHSKKPVCFTHALPAALNDSRRNKSEKAMRALADKGGIMGFCVFAPMMKRGNGSTVEDYVEAIEYGIDVMGEDQVAIGTDFTQDHGRPSAFQEWAQRDKGYARFTTPFFYAEVRKPKGIEVIGEMPNITRTMAQRGWRESRIRKVMGENWMRLFKDVWGR